MKAINSVPFVRITLSFILGLLLYKYWDSSSPFLFALLFGTSLLASIVYLLLPVKIKLAYGWLNGLSITALLFSLAYLLSYFHNVENKNTWYQKHASPQSKFRALLKSDLKETAKTYKATVSIIGIYNNNNQLRTTGDAILYFSKTDSVHNLKKGDQILFANTLNPILSRGNPGDFDYAQFCKNKGIYEQAFLKPAEWKKLNQENTNTLSWFDVWHQKIKKNIAAYIPNKNAQGIAQALITGYRDNINRDIYNQYAKTGLVHLLAISGLHMGIFFLGTQRILSLFPFFKKRKKKMIGLSIIAIWLFALLTTFPPSVQRACVMFTFLGIGQLINRKIPSINFLFASAFFLLLFQPTLLFEVGFQLSYAAVLGILLFYQPLSKLFYSKHWIVRKTWELMCLSLTAQIFTFPIAIYYFHQFPLLFLFTNLIAIPLVTIIIYGELLLILSSFFPPAAKMIGIIITELINFLNGFISKTSALPFVSIQEIQISLLQCFVLLACSGSLAVWLLGKRKWFAPLAIFCVLLFVSIQIFKKQKQLKQQQIIVYNTDTPYLEYINGTQAVTNDSIATNKKKNFEQYVRTPSHISQGILNQKRLTKGWHTLPNYDIMSIGNKKIVRIKKAYKLKTTAPMELDYLIISDKWIKNPVALITLFSPKEIIIDGNMPLWKIDELKTQLSEVNLPIHFVGTQGAKKILL